MDDRQTLLLDLPGEAMVTDWAIQTITAGPTAPRVPELLDHTTVSAIESLSPMGFDATVGALLLAQSHAPDAQLHMERLAALCRTSGAQDVAVSDEVKEAEMLLHARRLARPALERQGDWLLDDVCVPRSRTVDLLTAVDAVAKDEGMPVGVFGHADDGNMHPTIFFDNSNSNSRLAAQRTFDRITAPAPQLGGTIRGEHSVGRLKTACLDRKLDPGELAIHRALKEALDPAGLVNPGAMVGGRPSTVASSQEEALPCAP